MKQIPDQALSLQVFPSVEGMQVSKLQETAKQPQSHNNLLYSNIFNATTAKNNYTSQMIIIFMEGMFPNLQSINKSF